MFKQWYRCNGDHLTQWTTEAPHPVNSPCPTCGLLSYPWASEDLTADKFKSDNGITSDAPQSPDVPVRENPRSIQINSHSSETMMLERISSQLSNNRARYTHFIHADGTIACLYPLKALHEARVGVMCEQDFPTDLQYDAITDLAELAVGVNPAVSIRFDEATAPFVAKYPPMLWRFQ